MVATTCKHTIQASVSEENIGSFQLLRLSKIINEWSVKAQKSNFNFLILFHTLCILWWKQKQIPVQMFNTIWL